jgi:hypothetical protein
MVAVALDTARRPTVALVDDPPESAESKAADKAYASSLLAIRNVYDAAGAGVTAGAMRVDRGDLAKMLSPISGRRLWFQSLFAIRHLASAEQRLAIVDPIATHFGLYLAATPPAAPAAAMTDADRAARLEAGLLALGPLGAAMRDAMLGLAPAPASSAELESARARVRSLEHQVAALQEGLLGR